MGTSSNRRAMWRTPTGREAGGNSTCGRDRRNAAACRLRVDARRSSRYTRWFDPMQEHYRSRFPKDPADSDWSIALPSAPRRWTRCGPVACGCPLELGCTHGTSLRSAAARMRANPLRECQDYADAARGMRRSYRIPHPCRNPERAAAGRVSGGDEGRCGRTAGDCSLLRAGAPVRRSR